ncbi:MAG TPA: VOC family protein [Solirubrobacteraceae bacterium]|jgi:glyoxylase I family protein|nr:VOC family protein [Solirubrobacteraceae bacterium]
MTISAHHVGLTVTDIDRAEAWYLAALGFERQLGFELPGGARGAMLRSAAGARIELFEVPGANPGIAWADPPAAMLTEGFGHVAFECSDLDADFARAVGAGAGEVWAPRQSPEPGRRMAFIHDPDGNLIELIGAPE